MDTENTKSPFMIIPICRKSVYIFAITIRCRMLRCEMLLDIVIDEVETLRRIRY